METVHFIFILLAVICVTIQIYRPLARRRKNYEELLTKLLDEQRGKFISSMTPPLFDVGPFPKISVKLHKKFSRTPIGSGEYSVYRIVRFCDQSGEEKESWVKLDFVWFKFTSATWSFEGK